MTKKKLADAIRTAWIHSIWETSDDETIRKYLVCPDCGEERHRLDYEDVEEMIAEAKSLDDFDATYHGVDAELAEREKRAGLMAGPQSRFLN